MGIATTAYICHGYLPISSVLLKLTEVTVPVLEDSWVVNYNITTFAYLFQMQLLLHSKW